MGFDYCWCSLASWSDKPHHSIVIHRFGARTGTYLWMTPEQLLANLRDWPEEEVCRYLAAEIRRGRQQAGLSQREFAGFAGVPLRTYKRFETDGQGRMDTFVRSLRVLGRTEYLLTLFPPRVQPNSTRDLRGKLAVFRAREMDGDR